MIVCYSVVISVNKSHTGIIDRILIRYTGGSTDMKISILGTGAIGSLFASSLAADPSNEVLCITYSQEHTDCINQKGITIHEKDGTLTHTENLRAVTCTSGEKPADLVIVLVKSYSTADAVKGHPEIFGSDTTVLTLQNGYGNHVPLLEAADKSQILLGTTSHGMNIRDDGEIVHAGSGVTTIGALDPGSKSAQSRLETTAGILRNAGFETVISGDVFDAIFRKLFVNTAINALCALNDKPNRYIAEDTEMNKRSRQLVYEAVNTVNTLGRSYDPEKIFADAQHVAELTGSNICSMLADVRRHRPTEIRTINGAIVSMAESAGTDAPLNRAVVEEVETRFPY